MQEKYYRLNQSDQSQIRQREPKRETEEKPLKKPSIDGNSRLRTKRPPKRR